MAISNPSNWPYPGSRWWKFDFHTHTPASDDWKDDEVTPEAWLRRFMGAEIDCVAVTDHNSGEWIDKLKNAYADMQQQAETGRALDGFRELTLFPGVEISVSSGIHLLAILGPEASRDEINDLLVKVEYRGIKGSTRDAVTNKSPAQVIRDVLDEGGIPIPAHADQKKGLLRVQPGTTDKSEKDPLTLSAAIEVDGLLAIEWVEPDSPMPACVKNAARQLTKVLGSDCHSFCPCKSHPPGSRFTWIKMAAPTLEGLRLALLDGDGISVRRSDDEEPLVPFKTPKHFISKIEIASARFMGGDDAPQRFHLTPYYNALIGGRGTGKSTVVHALRLAYKRGGELKRLGENAESRRRFEDFATKEKGRDGDGALREGTEIRVELSRDGVAHRLRWRKKNVAVEEQDGQGNWCESASQALAADRFPIRLFSQGQISAMAGEGREALLGVIDEAAGVDHLRRDFDDEKRAWATKRARLRELDGQLADRPEVERKLADVRRKLKVLATSQHADVLKAQQRAVRQGRAVDTSLEQLASMPGRIEGLAQDLLLDDWPDDMFDPKIDKELLAWRDAVDGALAEAQNVLCKVAATLTDKTLTFRADPRFEAWRQRAEQAKTDYSALQETLESQGVSDPQEFGRLLQEREQFEDALKKLDDVSQERTSLEEAARRQQAAVLNVRKRITDARQKFVWKTLDKNKNSFVLMKVVGFGFDARSIERSLRELLECTSGQFERDILDLVSELVDARGEGRGVLLAAIKQRLIERDGALGGRFRNYLERKLERPEFADHILCWFPEDDLRIEYSRAGDGRDWTDIYQGSQGQRSAALLAFLLSFGDEPLVLDQPEDDLDNHLIYDLIVRQIRENKLRRQLVIVTHNPNVLVNGDAEMVHALDFRDGQCRVVERGALQQKPVREEVCRVMEGGREAFSRRWARLGREV